MARVTGIGGIFLKARDSKALAAWYARHLGIQLSEHGSASLLWTDEVPPTTGMTVWSLFPADICPCGHTSPQDTLFPFRTMDTSGHLSQGVIDWIYATGRIAWSTTA